MTTTTTATPIEILTAETLKQAATAVIPQLVQSTVNPADPNETGNPDTVINQTNRLNYRNGRNLTFKTSLYNLTETPVGENSREDYELLPLTQSILGSGWDATMSRPLIYAPTVPHPGSTLPPVVLVRGHRRRLALRSIRENNPDAYRDLRLSEVPCDIITDTLTDDEVKLLKLDHDATRESKRLNDWEKYLAIRMVESTSCGTGKDWTHQGVAAALGWYTIEPVTGEKKLQHMTCGKFRAIKYLPIEAQQLVRLSLMKQKSDYSLGFTSSAKNGFQCLTSVALELLRSGVKPSALWAHTDFQDALKSCRVGKAVENVTSKQVAEVATDAPATVQDLVIACNDKKVGKAELVERLNVVAHKVRDYDLCAKYYPDEFDALIYRATESLAADAAPTTTTTTTTTTVPVETVPVETVPKAKKGKK